MINLESTIFICFFHFLGVIVAANSLLVLCKKSKSNKLDSDSTRRETLKDAELESQLRELLDELSDSKRKKRRKKQKKKKKRKSKERRRMKSYENKKEEPEDAPRKIPLNEKEMKIAKGLKVASGDYPTMDNVKSDWDPE